MTKDELKDLIIQKQDEIIEIFTDKGHEIIADYLNELANLKKQLEECDEKYSDRDMDHAITGN